MCLALIAIGLHPLYEGIIISNRDEYYARDSAPAHFWHEYPDIFAGMDLAQHGTWLGVHKNGHFALITNYRDPQSFQIGLQSRGHLVSNYLTEYTNKSPLDYLKKIKDTAHHYNKFNLVFGAVHDAYYYSNVTEKAEQFSTGIYCLSNHLLDTPWYKVERAKTLFSEVLNQLVQCNDQDKTQDLLFGVLSDNTKSPDHLLPQTGIPIELERQLSSIFVDIPEHQYGTYSSSVILIAKNSILFAEKIFKNGRLVALQRTDITLGY